MFGLLLAILRGLPGPGVLPGPAAGDDLRRRVPGAAGAARSSSCSASGSRRCGSRACPTDEFFWAVVALTLVYSAYVSEVYRAGIESVHPSQAGGGAVARAVAAPGACATSSCPQAVRRVIPPLLNDFIGLQKDTVLVSFIGVVEIFRQTQILVGGDFNFTPYVATALIFLVVTIPLARFTDWLIAREQRPRARARERPRRPRSSAGRAMPGHARRRRPSTGDGARPCRSRACTSRSASSRCCAGIDLEVAEHEVVALIGASGSGKSTLLRCINLLEPIDAGRILDRGRRDHRQGRRRRPDPAADRDRVPGVQPVPAHVACSTT